MRRLWLSLFLFLMLVLSWNLIQAQDDDDLFIPLVPTQDELLVPIVPTHELEPYIPTLVPTQDDDDLFIPLVLTSTSTPMRPTRTPDPRIQLPTDGMYYKRSATTMEITGQCRKTRYDCDGCGGGVRGVSEDDLPQVPICGSAEGILPAVNIEGNPYLYIPPSTNLYGQSEFSFMQETDANGKTIGSFRVETRTDVVVVSRTEVHVVVSFIQEGGCTQTYTTVYTLASAGGVTCTPQNFASTPTPLPTATLEVTPAPEDEPTEPPQTPMRRTLYLIPDDYVDDQCNADNSFPELETVDVTFNDDYSVTVDVAGQSYILYRDSETSFGYESGMPMANSYSLSLSVITEGVEWSLLWRGTDAARNNCWRSMRLTIDAPVPATATPVADNTAQNGNGASGQNAVSGTYNAAWMTEYMPACDAIFEGMIPDSPTLDVTFEEGAATVDFGEGAMLLTADQDWYMYYPPATDGIQLGIMLFEDSSGDGWLLSWSAMADDKTCVTSAMLTRS